MRGVPIVLLRDSVCVPLIVFAGATCSKYLGLLLLLESIRSLLQYCLDGHLSHTARIILNVQTANARAHVWIAEVSLLETGAVEL